MGSTIDFNPNTTVDMDSSSTKRKTGASNAFGLDDFYALLAVQLQNQDMMNPVDDSQFVAQMAQMATIQAMDQMNEMTMTSYAFSFMGKDVIISDMDDTGRSVTITGPVEKVVLYNGKPQVFVGGKAYELAQVMEVLTPTTDSTINLFDLIDRNVAVQVVDKENSTDKETKYKLIYGVVDKVTMYDGKKQVYVDGTAYAPEQIVEVLPAGQDSLSARRFEANPFLLAPQEEEEMEEEEDPVVEQIKDKPTTSDQIIEPTDSNQVPLPEYHGEQGNIPVITPQAFSNRIEEDGEKQVPKVEAKSNASNQSNTGNQK